MIVDVAHASHAAVADMLRLATRPLVSSHGGVQATCKVNRNLTDDEIARDRAHRRRGRHRLLGRRGLRRPAGGGRQRDRACPRGGGIDHVGLGSDYRRRGHHRLRRRPAGGGDAGADRRGFSDDDIAKIMGGNMLRVLRAGIAPPDRSPTRAAYAGQAPAIEARACGGDGRQLGKRLARRDRRARQFRRLSPGAPGGGRARRSRWRATSGRARDRRDLRPASDALLPARHAAVPPDHARPAPARCSARRGRMRWSCSISTARSAALTAEQFVAERLVANLGAAGVVTGEDFTFGTSAAAISHVLRDLGARHGFTVETVGPVRAAMDERRPRSPRAASATC